MTTNNKLSFSNILERFNDENTNQQIQNLKKQLKQFDSQNKNNDSNTSQEAILQKEQKIFSIISTTLSEKVNYFITNQNTFSFELFIYVFFEKIRNILSKIVKNSKSIENSLFHKINRNTIKKIQSIIINFLISFYDFYENEKESNIDKIVETIINKNVVLEESYLLSYVKIILILNNHIEPTIIKNVFNDKQKEFHSLISEIIAMLIKIINLFIIIKKNKNMFNIEDNIIISDSIKNNKGYYNFNYFDNLIYITYINNEPYLMKLLYDVIFNNYLQYFFGKIIKNDDITKILLNNLSIDIDIRKRLLKMLNESLFVLEKQNQKDLLKAIKSNDSITIIFNFISEDLKSKKYNEISDLLEELKILYIFSLLIHSHDINSEKIIIQLLNNNLHLMKNDEKSDADLNTFITNVYKLSKNMPKYKYKIYNFLLLIFDSIKRVRKIISEIFFNNMNGNIEEYSEMIKNVSFFNLFINNLSSSEPEVINNYFNFLYSLDKAEYLPLNEIIQIISQLQFFTEKKTAQALVDNLIIFTDINYLCNGKDIDIMPLDNNDDYFNSEEDKSKKSDNKDTGLNKYYKYIKHIYQSFVNILYNIISDIRENINSLKYKSPFDNDVTVSSIINTNYSSMVEDNNQSIPFDILNIFLDYLSIIIKDNKMFQYFISKKFLEFFPFLANDDKYKQIAYKLIQIFLNSPNNNEENKEKNKKQILIILNRFYLFFSKDRAQDTETDEKNYDEIYKLKELLLMQDTIKIFFKKKLIEIKDAENKTDNLNEKIIKFYCFYSEYINDYSQKCYQIYNNEYHSLIKKYLSTMIRLIAISNKNIITKNNNYSPTNLKKNIKATFENIIKFYALFPENNKLKNEYFLDIIKFFIDKSFNFIFSKDKTNNNNDNNTNNNEMIEEEKLSEDDFTLFYINKYKINKEILEDNNDNKNKSIITNFCIQSPMIILSLLKLLFKYNKYLNPYLHFILFLCKINHQNIIFLLKQNLIKKLFKILKDIPFLNDIIFEICNLCFKFLQKENICLLFEQLIKLSNNEELNTNSNYNNKDFIKGILHNFTNSLRVLSITSNDYCKGILLSKYKVRQPNIYNLLEINNLDFSEDNDMFEESNNNFIIKQEIYFYKSLKIKKLLLLRLENEKNKKKFELKKSFKEKRKKNDYLEISIKNLEISVSEKDELIKYDDLSNYNSIFLDNDKNTSEINNYLELNKKNEIIYIFKEDKKLLSIYINGNKVTSYKYTFKFDESITIKIGFPLDLVKDVFDNKFKMFSHIKIKSLKIFLQKNDTKEIIKNIYQLLIEKISCDYLFADELTNFKLDENTKLISKYNSLYSARINSIFHKNFIKSQFYKKIFFTTILLSNSLDYMFRLEKYIFILLNNLNIDRIIFNELISLLCTYLIINENFLPKFLSKEEFNSSLYFSLYRNAKFIDKEVIENLISLLFMNDSKNIITYNNNIIDILLDIKLFDSLNTQAKADLINVINNKIIQNNQTSINKTFIIEKLAKILILCQFNNKNDIDELIIDIIFGIYENNTKDVHNTKVIEDIIYMLFSFDIYSSNHLNKFKNGRINETSKIINEYFNKIYNKDIILRIKEIISKKLVSILIDNEFKEKLFRYISAYTPPKLLDTTDKKNELNDDSCSISILSFEDEDEIEEDDNILFKLPSCPFKKKRSLSISFNKHISLNRNSTLEEGTINKIYTGRMDLKKKTINSNKTKLLINKNKNIKKEKHSRFYNYDINDFSLKYGQCRQQNSINPIDDVILFKGVINGKERKSLKNIFKNKIEKKNTTIIVNITDVDKENCNGDCHLCSFIKGILVSIFKREIKFGIYKNYLLHCLSEVFIMNNNLDFKYNFSYHLMKREGPSRIRKRFCIRIDKLLNSEYDRSAFERKKVKKEDKMSKFNKNNNNVLKDKSIDLVSKEMENEVEKLFMFYEKKKGYISENLLNFFNLGQIYNIEILPTLVDFDDTYLCSFNCLLFKGLSYINAAFILGKNKIYILSTVNISLNNILYEANYPITKRFWITKKYNDILQEHCEYLNSYDIAENIDDGEAKNTQKKKKLFEKTLKGFWLYSFYYVEINEIHKRKFLHQNNAIEIFLKNGKNYYLTFNLGIRDKLVKLIINYIKISHQSKNVAFFINNNYDSVQLTQKQELSNSTNSNIIKKSHSEEINDNINNMVYEIQNESLVKSDNMIFIIDNNLFIDMSKKNKKNNFYKNIFKSKKIKFTLATITDINEVIEKSYDKWTNGHLDTYSYLMILNTISGRTYSDIAQYPVFPWVLSNYSTKELDLTNPKSFRNFNYPIYAQDEETRENLKNKYESFEEDQKDFKYHSGSHYSNAGFVCYYLIRIKPYSQLAAEVQGEFFDTTDRLFFNIDAFYKVNEKYQELIPEVFHLPEILINSNKFNFGLTSDGTNIDNVSLPPWASYSPRLFGRIMKKSLESQYVSMHINEWIDLIFGFRQKGSDAEKCFNVLRYACSAFNPKKDCEDENELEQKINELCELGINPIQLFNKPHHRRERHQKIKAFFGRNIYLPYIKQKGEKYLLKNLEPSCVIKEMNKYYEYSSNYISKGEGGLSSFKMCFEEDSDNFFSDNKDTNNNLIYFVVTGKKTLIPPSYKNYIQWSNYNYFYIIKPFKKIKYKFIIHHMKKQSINCIKITKDGTFIIIGYSNGVIEKYKLIRLWGPRIKPAKGHRSSVANDGKNNKNRYPPTSKRQRERTSSNDDNFLYQNSENKISNDNLEKYGRKKEKSMHIKGGLFNTLFGAKKKLKNLKKDDNNNVNDEKIDDEEENKKIIEELEKSNFNKNKIIPSFPNEILFDTHIPISTSNIINSDCIILNNNTGKFIQYNGYPSNFELYSDKNNNGINNKNDNNIKDNNPQIEIPGYDIYSNTKNNLYSILNRENHSSSLSKHYIIFLINSSSRILSEISLIEICETYSLMLVTDKLNNLYIYDFKTFDLIRNINCSIYFKHKIKYISICPFTGDFILASYYRVILMSINGVFITQMNNMKSKINYCLITSIHRASSDIYLFTAHEDGNILISKIISNLNGIIFNINKSSNDPSSNNLLNSMSIDTLNNKYDPIRIKNISEVYYNAYNTNYENNKNEDRNKYYKYLENNNNLSLIFDTPMEIKCSEYSIKYIKLSQDLSSLLCINSKNNLIYLNYEDFFTAKKKNKDKKNMVFCEKCQNMINSFKTLCNICGKKLCPNCKTEKIIAECSLKNPKPICDECSHLVNKNNQNLYDF